VFLDFGTVGPGDVDPEPIRRLVTDLVLYADTDPVEIAPRLADADIALVNKVHLDEVAIGQAPRLKLICLAATGTDNVDLQAARDRGVAVSNIRNYCTPSVTQHVFALILALNQHLRRYDELVLGGAWTEATSFCLLEPTFAELAGRTLGIVGLGNLGRSVAQVAHAFGMRVLAAQRPYRSAATPGESSVENGVRRVSFAELLAHSHILSLHCPLTDETRELIDAAALDRMRPDALLINTARGALVEPRALIAALRNRAIAGAGIDVLDREPPRPDHPLLTARLSNLIITPHMAWAAREARQRALAEMAENIAGHLRGGGRNRVV
jgi:glycerate dehydrogenase